jgi:hypothetical protein
MALSIDEMNILTETCRNLPDGEDYVYDDYVENLMRTVLDFQMSIDTTLNKALDNFKLYHPYITTHGDLKDILSKYADSDEGNRTLARLFWNNNHWSRVAFLRTLINEFETRGIVDQKSLRDWLQTADFRRDVEGQFRRKFQNHPGLTHSIGLAIFHWLLIRCDIDTVKPDRHILASITSVIGRRVSQQEAVDALKTIAARSGRKARRLEAAIYKNHKRQASHRKDPAQSSFKCPEQVRTRRINALSGGPLDARNQ